MAFLSLLASRHVDENSVHDATNNARVISLAASGNHLTSPTMIRKSISVGADDRAGSSKSSFYAITVGRMYM